MILSFESCFEIYLIFGLQTIFLKLSFRIQIDFIKNHVLLLKIVYELNKILNVPKQKKRYLDVRVKHESQRYRAIRYSSISRKLGRDLRFNKRQI